MAQNGQLVSGEDAALKALAALSTEQSFIRAVTPYTAEDKQLPGLARSGRTEIVVSTVAGQGGAAARTAVGAASVPTASNVAVAGIVQQRVAIEGADIAAIAALGGVVAIEPSDEPQLLDERAARIVDGQLNAGFQPTLGTRPPHLPAQQRVHQLQPGNHRHHRRGRRQGRRPVPAGSHPDFFRAGNRPPTPSRHRLRAGEHRRRRRTRATAAATAPTSPRSPPASTTQTGADRRGRAGLQLRRSASQPFGTARRHQDLQLRGQLRRADLADCAARQRLRAAAPASRTTPGARTSAAPTTPARRSSTRWCATRSPDVPAISSSPRSSRPATPVPAATRSARPARPRT